MKQPILLVYICAAVACGFIAGILWANRSPNGPTEQVTPSIRTVVERVPAQDMGLCGEKLAECEQRLEFASNVIGKQMEERTGTPVPFPDDLPTQYTAEEFETAVREALAECKTPGLELAYVDCSEFPCMAFFSQPAKSYNHGVYELRECEGWSRRFESGGGANSSFMTDEGVAEYSMMSVSPRSTDRDENASTRWRVRLSEGEAALIDAWGGREFTEIEEVELSMEFWHEARVSTLQEEGGASDTSAIDDIIAELEAKHARLLTVESEILE
jgi:hypothetical protein